LTAILMVAGVMHLLDSPRRASGASVQDYFGLNAGHLEWSTVPATDVAFALSQAKQVGTRWMRVNVQWSDVQYSGSNAWDWSGSDKVIDAGNAQGLQTLALLTYSPKWAIPAQYQGLTAKNDWERYGPTNASDFATFAAAAAARYSARGVHAFEIWNEANCQYWKPAPNAADYDRLLAAAYPAIKQADPAAVVVSSGLAPYGSYGQSNASCINPLTFLEQMYANGARGNFDGLGWHPNNWSSGSPTQAVPWNAFYQMYGTTPSAVSIMSGRADSKKIWMTEFGYPTADPGAVTNNNEALQGQYLSEGYRAATSASWSGPVFWFNQRDDAGLSFGLHHNDWSKKPAWSAYRNLAVGGGPPPDTSPPTGMAVTAPRAGQQISGTVTLQGNGTDNVGITGYQFFVDNRLVGNATASGSTYSMRWNSATVRNGSHTVNARACDAAANCTTSASVGFTVRNRGG
jgi:hypothetical protein